jgi:uncharacterized protein (TIRG00374 family)
VQILTRIRDLRKPPVQTAKRKSWIVGFKALVTVSLLGILFWRIDLSKFLEAISHSLNLWLLQVILASILLILISIFKWDLLLRALGISMSRWTLIRIYAIGVFASSFLPGLVGGDFVRWQMTARQTGQSLRIAASILIERVSGVVAIVLLAPVAVLYDVPRLGSSTVLLLISAIALATACAMVLALSRRLGTAIMFTFRHSRIGFLVRPLYRLHRTLRQFPPGSLLAALGYSLLFYLGSGLKLFLLCQAFGVDLGYWESFSAQILTNLLGLLPVSIGGLGVIQAGHVYFLGLYGVDGPDALGISIVGQLTLYGWALMGWVFFMRWRDARELAE